MKYIYYKDNKIILLEFNLNEEIELNNIFEKTFDVVFTKVKTSI